MIVQISIRVRRQVTLIKWNDEGCSKRWLFVCIREVKGSNFNKLPNVSAWCFLNASYYRRLGTLTLRRLMSYIYGAAAAAGPAARLLRSWVRIPPGAWIFVCCECRVLSGRGLCDELITRPEESYRLCCVFVCDLESSRMGAPYIYDISSLKVNNLTLILLTWRKWWAPNNVSE